MESRPYEWFGTTVKAMGDEKGLAFMREFAKQDNCEPAGICSLSSSPRGSSKARSAAYSQTFEVLKPAGAPVDWVYLNPVFANIHPTGIATKAPHPNAARLFIDFVLSKRGRR